MTIPTQRRYRLPRACGLQIALRRLCVRIAAAREAPAVVERVPVPSPLLRGRAPGALSGLRPPQWTYNLWEMKVLRFCLQLLSACALIAV